MGKGLILLAEERLQAVPQLPCCIRGATPGGVAQELRHGVEVLAHRALERLKVSKGDL